MIALIGCDHKVDRDFFAPADGIVIGTPQSFDRKWILPVKFQTATIHSAVWVGSVDFRIDERKIYITAMMTDDQKSFANHLDLGSIDNGEYELIYLNTDGMKIPLEKFKIDNQYTADERKVQEQNSTFHNRLGTTNDGSGQKTSK